MHTLSLTCSAEIPARRWLTARHRPDEGNLFPNLNIPGGDTGESVPPHPPLIVLLSFIYCPYFIKEERR